MTTIVVTLYLLTLCVLAIYGMHRTQLLWTYVRHRKDSTAPTELFAEENLPLVTVQLPIFNERYVVQRLLDAVAALDYPRDKFQVQLLDDSTDDTRQIAELAVAELRKTGLDIEHIHRVDRTGYKAGALEHALPSAKGEFLLVFDADFVPQADILRRLVHHFTDPKVGMVQARWGHINRFHSPLTECQAMMLDGHFTVEHVARNRSGVFFNFNGTAGIWRKTTIADAGGWQHDTITEDVDLSYRAQLKGWRFVYVHDTVAPAEVPCEMNSFKTQQYRWAKGSVQTARKLLGKIFSAEIPFKTKLEAMFHLTNNFAYLFLLLLAILQLPNLLLRASMDRPELLLLDVPLFISTFASICVFYFISNKDSGVGARHTMQRLPMMIALGIGLSVNNARAVIDGLFGKNLEFIRTPKHGVTDANTNWSLLSYRSKLPAHTYVELGLAIYFALTLLTALALGSWLHIPFLLLFAAGFFYVGGLSLHQRR